MKKRKCELEKLDISQYSFIEEFNNEEDALERKSELNNKESKEAKDLKWCGETKFIYVFK